MKCFPCAFFLFLLSLPAELAHAQPLTATLQAGIPGNSGTTESPFEAARFTSPKGVSVSPGTGSQPIYVLDSSHALRRINPGIGIPVVAGSLGSTGFLDATGTAARFNQPSGLVVDVSGDVYIADTRNHSVRYYSATSGSVTTVKGTGFAGSQDDGSFSAEFNLPTGIAIDSHHNLYVADTGNHTIRKLTSSLGGGYTMTTLAGKAGFTGLLNATGAGARFNKPQGIAVDSDGNVYVADTDNNCIRKISAAGVASVFVGAAKSGTTDGVGAAALFNRPVGIAYDAKTKTLFVADTGNHTLRQVTMGKVVTTVVGLAGTSGAVNGEGIAARFNGLSAVTVSGDGKLSVADTGNHTIRGVFGAGKVPVIKVQPKGLTVAPLAKAVFTITATGPADIVVTWRKNGDNLVDVPGHITGSQATKAGATTLTSTLTITGVTEADQGSYSALVDNPFGRTRSLAVPLTVTGQPTWLWASPIGGVTDDAALDLVVEQPVGAGLGALWLASRNGGHALQKHALATGVRSLLSVIDAKGDGANALARNTTTGELFVGADVVLSNAGRPGLLVKKNAAGKTQTGWSKYFATGRGSNASITSSADGLGVAVDATGNAFVTGYLQGFGKFSNTNVADGSGIAVGSSTATANHAFLTKYNAAGTVAWARDIFSHDDRESLGLDVVTDAAGNAYVCGVVGSNARFQLAEAASSDASDFHQESNTGPLPFVAKYDAAGNYQWSYLPTYTGRFLSMHVAATGELWVTGYDGDRLDPGRHTAVLERLDVSAGTSLQQLRVPGGKGCSLDTDPVRGLAWLVLDSGGLVSWGGRQFGVSGYRVIQVDAGNFAEHWDLPVFGAATLSPLEWSEQADIRYGSNGKLYTALTFQDPGNPGAQVEFTGRKTFSIVGRHADGFIACIAEKPLIATQPVTQLVTKGLNFELSAAPAGTLTPLYQWYKNGKAIKGKTSALLSFTNTQLTDAGDYTVRLSNGVDSVLSQVAQVGVVEVINAIQPVAAAGKTAVTVPSAGSGLHYEWRKNTGAVPSTPRITGLASKTLALKDLARPGDDGDYDCIVTGPGGDTITSGITTLVTQIKPILNPITFSDGIVSGSYLLLPTAMNDALSFLITGLPTGLHYNTSTGVISGKPTSSGSFTISITAINAAGSSVKVTSKLIIAPLPAGTSGLYTGLVNRHASLSNNLGGRLSIAILPSGEFTGKYTEGAAVTAFSDALNASMGADPTLSVALGSRTLSLTLYPSVGSFDGTLSDASSASVAVTGYRHITAPGAAYAGSYQMTLAIQAAQVGDSSIPQSSGQSSFKVEPTKNTFSVLVTQGDGSVVLQSCSLGVSGGFALYGLSDTNSSTALGMVQIAAPPAAATLSGIINWRKASGTGGTYDAGFGPILLDVGGGRTP